MNELSRAFRALRIACAMSRAEMLGLSPPDIRNFFPERVETSSQPKARLQQHLDDSTTTVDPNSQNWTARDECIAIIMTKRAALRRRRTLAATLHALAAATAASRRIREDAAKADSFRVRMLCRTALVRWQGALSAAAHTRRLEDTAQSHREMRLTGSVIAQWRYAAVRRATKRALMVDSASQFRRSAVRGVRAGLVAAVEVLEADRAVAETRAKLEIAQALLVQARAHPRPLELGRLAQWEYITPPEPESVPDETDGDLDGALLALVQSPAARRVLGEQLVDLVLG
ncbi:hypothetical protein J8273_3659 [Carpediemonas membranifera]|uniref:Uncharacterized protein n=1 Tax=Carpediemonas membranifera TaxID=201153 RepID=A0A8J6E4M7_9EUKA|nr:hypothetical protein J8273_3659 [Carpediemonas membranifera]|eukprot:KAG9394687.1 hypothetical protein J8273_3659 [Carpediemonas membranifera]